MKLIKEITIKRHQYNKDEYLGCYTEEVRQYQYKNNKEKLNHSRQMQDDGYEDSGQQKINLGTVSKWNFVWCGVYTKITKEEVGLTCLH